MRKLSMASIACLGLFAVMATDALAQRTAEQLPADNPTAGQLPAESDLAIVAGACIAATAALAVAPPAAAFVGFTCIVIGGQEWSNSQE